MGSAYAGDWFPKKEEDKRLKSVCKHKRFQMVFGSWGEKTEFDYHGKTYGVGKTPEGLFSIWEMNHSDSERLYPSSKQLLEYIIDGKRLSQIIMEIDVDYRTI